MPQELATDMFETVWNTMQFSRGLFGKPRIRGLRRAGAARAVALGQEGLEDHDALGRHEAPRDDRQGAVARAHILFLDEPTAGVDVELRRDMWQMVRGLRERGVTIILTTHYIEEAEEMADRIGVINKGELIAGGGEGRADAQAGQEAAHAAPAERLAGDPGRAGRPAARAREGRHELVYTFDTQARGHRHRVLLRRLNEQGIDFKDLHTEESSLEDIFVRLVRARP